jgi:hypothetical protein
MVDKPNEDTSSGDEAARLDDQTDNLNDGARDTMGEEPASDTHQEPVEEAYHEAYDEHEEQRGTSMSARILRTLAVLVVGAGVALWGAPKLAPMLPQWAAPIVPYLTPGGDAAVETARNEVEALRTELNDKIAGLNTEIDSDAVREIAGAVVEESVTALENSTQEQLTVMSDTIAAADSGEIEARLAQLEVKIEGLSEQLESQTTALQSVSQSGGELSEDALAQLTTNAGLINGLKAEIEQVSAMTGSLSQRIDEVEVTAERKVAEANDKVAEANEEMERVAASASSAEAAASFKLGLEGARRAVARGAPLADHLDKLQAVSDAPLPDVLLASAETGVASIDALVDRFGPLAHEAIQSDIRANNEGGALSKLGAFVQSQLATRSLEPVEGDGTDAILSRIGAAIEDGNLQAVLSESEGLNEAAKSVLGGWIEDVNTRAQVIDALDAVSANAS